MSRSGLRKSLLVVVASLALVLIPYPAFAQHGGGHAGGGGGMHGGGGGFHGSSGGFHGGSAGGGFHGGYGGGYHGSYSRGGGAYSGGYAQRGAPYGSMRGAYSGARSSSAGRPWSWEGHSSRNTSPGWHQFSSANRAPMGPSSAAGTSARAASPEFASRASMAPVSGHPAIRDGQWHSFAIPHTQTARVTSTPSFNHAGMVPSNHVWHGNNWGWHGGWHGGWHTWGWGWPGWNWGWGWGWGCCGWGWGVGFGWGWGWWGPGWGTWSPFWAWPAYYYNPWLDNSWLDAANDPAPYVLDPYPA